MKQFVADGEFFETAIRAIERKKIEDYKTIGELAHDLKCIFSATGIPVISEVKEKEKQCQNSG